MGHHTLQYLYRNMSITSFAQSTGTAFSSGDVCNATGPFLRVGIEYIASLVSVKICVDPAYVALCPGAVALTVKKC
jgi:hypothetical protein